MEKEKSPRLVLCHVSEGPPASPVVQRPAPTKKVRYIRKPWLLWRVVFVAALSENRGAHMPGSTASQIPPQPLHTSSRTLPSVQGSWSNHQRKQGEQAESCRESPWLSCPARRKVRAGAMTHGPPCDEAAAWVAEEGIMVARRPTAVQAGGLQSWPLFGTLARCPEWRAHLWDRTCLHCATVDAVAVGGLLARYFCSCKTQLHVSRLVQ